jgi:diguanylate cyclase (GGDEF)-like protein/hemerythrin-like metal-binding protein
MNNIGFSRNLQLRKVRAQLEAHKQELLAANDTLHKHVKEIDELQEQLRDQANRDSLTNLYNRRFLDATLSRELARCSRDGKPLSLVMIDVDHFKKYNDYYGHQAGDQCLKSVAQTLKASAKRASDLAARYGGEEFSLVLADTDAATAMNLAEAVRQAVESLQLPHVMAQTGLVTISVGVATSTSEVYQDADTLLRAADTALYRAKHCGRNQVISAPNIQLPISVGSDDAAHSARLEWHENFACGQKVIDDAHRELFSIGNLILDRVVAGSPLDEVVKLVDELLHRVEQHFHEEEAIVAATGFPGVEEHAVAHRQLMDQAHELAGGFRAKRQDIGEFSRFLAHDVVARHMLEMDRAFIPYLPARAAL